MVVEALSELVSEPAARRLLQKVTRGHPPSHPEEWAALIEGPLLQELASVLPLRHLTPPLEELVRTLRQASPPLPLPPGSLHDLARVEGVEGILIEGQEPWVRGIAPRSQPLLQATHRILLGGGYRVLWVLAERGQILLAALPQEGWLALVAKRETNTGLLLYHLRGGRE
jgi:hypothetical protein